MKNNFLNFTVYNVPEKNEADFTFSGNNQKNILVAYTDEGEEFFTYLQRVMSSVKINITDDCLILKTHTDNTTLPRLFEIKRHNLFSKAIFFGISPLDLGLQIDTLPLQKIIFIQNTQLLFTDKLSIVQKSSVAQRSLLRANLILISE